MLTLPVSTTPAQDYIAYLPNMVLFKNSLTAFYTLVTVILVAGICVTGQHGANMCCNAHGDCGTGPKYCRKGCLFGPCYGATVHRAPFTVTRVVTDDFFNRIANQAATGCPGRGFYTKSAFLQALQFYPSFGTSGSAGDSMREIAAFFAHVTHETNHMCSIVENGESATASYCDNSNRQYPCASGVGYYGRGPLQLKWNYNYGPAGQSNGFDGLNNPGIITTNNIISFRTAVWFWMRTCHDPIVTGQGFGATIRAINSLECNGSTAAAARVGYYKEYCGLIGVDPESNLYC